MVDRYVGVYVIEYGGRARRCVISKEQGERSKDWYRIDISGMPHCIYRRAWEMKAWMELRGAKKEEVVR